MLETKDLYGSSSFKVTDIKGLNYQEVFYTIIEPVEIKIFLNKFNENCYLKNF